MARALTDRERAVLDALVSVDFEGADDIRAQAASVRVVRTCDCGCPSVDFRIAPGVGLHPVVEADVAGTRDTVFLYLLGGQLGGIEYVNVLGEQMPGELPHPSRLDFD